MVIDINEERCREEAGRIRDAFRVETVPLVIDLRDENALREVPRVVQKALGRLDILVNCAALAPAAGLGGYSTPFPSQTSETWRLR